MWVMYRTCTHFQVHQEKSMTVEGDTKGFVVYLQYLCLYTLFLTHHDPIATIIRNQCLGHFAEGSPAEFLLDLFQMYLHHQNTPKNAL